MPSATVLSEIAIERTPRVMQLEGLFDLPPATKSQRRWRVEMPIESRAWNVGLITGPSGSGKTSIARTLFPDEMNRRIVWPSGRSLVDAFPREMPMREIVAILNGVGFASPPNWLKPFRCLSTGEQFRADLARRIATRTQSRKRSCARRHEEDAGVPLAIASASVVGSQPKDRLTQRREAAKYGAKTGRVGMAHHTGVDREPACGEAQSSRDHGHSPHACNTVNPEWWAMPTLRNPEPSSLAASRLCVTPSSNHDGACSPIVVDEFTSSLDRTVARFGSAAVAKVVRALGLRLIAISCHDDILDWLDPDWVYRADAESFAWRSLQGRPRVELDISPAPRSMWSLFRPHHYLTSTLSPSAQCYVGTVDHRPAVFTAVIHFPHPTSPGWREHRTVCLPDFQGVGLGNAQSDLVAAMYRATGKPYRSVTSAPAMIRHRARSENWFMTRKPGRVASAHHAPSMKRRSAHERITASFEYVGPPRIEEAKKLGIV